MSGPISPPGRRGEMAGKELSYAFQCVVAAFPHFPISPCSTGEREIDAEEFSTGDGLPCRATTSNCMRGYCSIFMGKWGNGEMGRKRSMK